MPLTMAQMGQTHTVKQIRGKDEVCRLLANMGFIAGSSVTVVSHDGGNLIVSVLDSRVALSQGMASRILI